MNNILIPVLLLFLTLVSVYIVNKIKSVGIGNEKFVSITGIRGFLAFSIFIYHSNIWFQYLQTNIWESPKMGSIVYFGQTRILLFFMITSFLFTFKMYESKNAPIDWKRFFVARFLRIFPMYFVSILLLILVVFIESDFELNDKITQILKDSLHWINFTITGIPNINKLENVWLINAGVAWTLPIEIIFYFFVPIFSLFFNIKPSYKVILISILGMVYVTYFNIPQFHVLSALIIGIVLGIIQNLNGTVSNFKKIGYFLFSILILTTIYELFFEAKHTFALLISTVIFSLIAYDKTMFGLLKMPLIRRFGQITYSFYLLHGILLFVTFNYFVEIENLKSYSKIDYFKIIALTIFPLIFISHFSYIYIEVPFIKLTQKLIKKK